MKQTTQHPLLTREQLIDWLIYHVPMRDNEVESDFGKDGVWDQYPFGVSYVPQQRQWYSIYATGSDPMMAYIKAAESIMGDYRSILVLDDITKNIR